MPEGDTNDKRYFGAAGPAGRTNRRAEGQRQMCIRDRNITMTFEEMKKIVVDTLNCEEDKVTMEASLTEDLEADSLDAVELNLSLIHI